MNHPITGSLPVLNHCKVEYVRLIYRMVKVYAEDVIFKE